MQEVQDVMYRTHGRPVDKWRSCQGRPATTDWLVTQPPVKPARHLGAAAASAPAGSVSPSLQRAVSASGGRRRESVAADKLADAQSVQKAC